MTPSNRTKNISMCIIIIFTVLKVAAAENPPPSNASVSDSGNVIKTIQHSDNLYIEKIGTYALEQDGCSICWEVNVDRQNKKITLSSRQPANAECTIPFKKQLPLHRKIFNEIFKDWEKKQFQTLFTGPMHRIEPAGTWNIRIAMAAADSPEWTDWCSNYPNHSSGKSINQIFVELADQVDAYRELESLFKEFGLKIALNSVEKVFNGKAEDLPFFQELKSKGLKGNRRVIYDAGMIYFSISSAN